MIRKPLRLFYWVGAAVLGVALVSGMRLPAVAAGAPSDPTPRAPSTLAARIVATLPLQPTNVNVTVVSNIAGTVAGTGVVETVLVRPPPGMRDGFMYTIVIDHQARQYWVERSGGIAGRRERRGPLSCDGLGAVPEPPGSSGSVTSQLATCAGSALSATNAAIPER